jgi:hypothetical protein
VPRNLMTLFAGSITIMVYSQVIAHKISFALLIPTVNLLLSFAVLFGTAMVLPLWLEMRPRRKPVEETTDQRKKQAKKNSHPNRG